MTQTEYVKMAKAANPFLNFDYTKWIVDFDPAKWSDEFAKFANQYKIDGVDMNAVVDAQRKNIEALSAANRVAIEGFQAVAKRQAEILKETLDTLAGAISEIGKSGTPQDAAAKQAELAKEAFETALGNMRELAEMVAKSNGEAAQAINARISESLDELKQLALKTKKKPH
jgi:phasin family protein